MSSDKKIMQSKLVKPADRSRKTSQNKFIPLIRIQNDRVFAQQEGLQVLRKITCGSLVLVAFEESETDIPFTMFECSQLNNARNQPGIWISENFVEDDEYGVKLVGLVAYAGNTEDLMRVHMINSILASIVVVNVYPGYSGFRFLKSIQGRVSYSRNPRDNDRLSKELANLVILERGSSSDTSLTNDQGRIDSIERNQGLKDTEKLYRSVSFFPYPKDEELRYNARAQQQLHTKFIQLHLSYPREQHRLEYGPVLAQYIPEIIREYNSKYSINYSEAIDRIQIDDGYEAYMEGLDAYNESLKRRFTGNDPVKHPEADLKQFRHEAVAVYKRRTNDMEYLDELNQTINEKEEKVLLINDRIWQEQNFQILKNQSKALIKYSQNRDDTNFNVKKEVERINGVYTTRAGGRTKEEDFNRFLEKLNETLGEDNYDKNVQISRLARDNQKLEDRLKKMQRKGGCCGGEKCEIM